MNTVEYERVEICSEWTVRMLEALNKSLELIQTKTPVIGSNHYSQVESRVLECIGMLCSPVIAFSAENHSDSE